jgi:hypothetical protein
MVLAVAFMQNFTQERPRKGATELAPATRTHHGASRVSAVANGTVIFDRTGLKPGNLPARAADRRNAP